MNRILVFHNQLWSQYKSCIFEGLHKQVENSQLLVIQTSISEEIRKDLVNFDVHSYPYQYPFHLLNNKTLESSNSFSTALSWIYWIFKFKPTAINLTGYSELGTLPVLLISRLFGIKTYMTNESVLGFQHQPTTCLNRIKKAYKTFLFSMTTGFFSYGINSNTFLFFHGVPKQKIKLFLNAFDKSKFLSAGNKEVEPMEKYILFVGRLSPEKNLDALIALAKYIKSQQLNYHLIVVGDGPLKSSFIKQISDLPIQYKGSVAWEQLAELYRHAAALYLPSIIEPWGMVANEAQELGIPVICSEACGCAHDLIISTYSGLVCDENNCEEIFEYLNKGFSSDFIRKNARIFSVEKLVDQMQIALESHG